MSRRRLIISYQSTPDLGVWQRIQPDFIAQLPLRNLHWKTATRALRTIQSLEIDLRAFQTLPADQAQQIPPSLLERPYLHLLFVACDDNDVYRQTLRQQIREWLDAISLRRNQEWLIVYVASSKVGPSKFYQRKSAVVDKIKADFNIGKRDRVAQLAFATGGSADDPILWAELMSKIKDSIIMTFDANVVSFEEEVRKIDSQRTLPGWNFCMFFIQKEGLALSFEAMNLFEDALIQYDELEASFFQSLRENTLVWFGKVGGTAQGDDAIDIFSANAKPYRDLIKSNTISLFDFRMYLFARQGALLGRLGKTLEIARRGMAFIGNISYSLRQQHSSLDSDFVSAWTYSAATQIVKHCDESLASVTTNGSGSDAHHAVRAELLDLASKQLEKIGITHHLLPNEPPFASSVDVESAPPVSPIVDNSHSGSKTAVSHPDIIRALMDRSVLLSMLQNLLSQAAENLAASQRHRAAARLQIHLAAYDELSKRSEQASHRFHMVSDTYAQPHWSQIECNILGKLSFLQGAAGHYKEQLLTNLSLLRAGKSLGSKRWRLPISDRGRTQKEIAARLVKDITQQSQALENDFAAIAFPTFDVDIADEYGRRDAESGTSVVDVKLTNHLPCPLPLDEMRLKLTSADADHIWLSSAACTLQTGENVVSCHTSTAVVGTCFLETSQLRMAKVVFQYAHRMPTRDLAPDIRRMPTSASSRSIVHFALDPHAVRLSLVDVERVVVGEPRMIHLRVAAGHYDIRDARLSLTVSSQSISLNMGAAKVESGSTTSVKTDPQSLQFSHLPRSRSLIIAIPFAVHTKAPSAVIHAVLQYGTAGGDVGHTKVDLMLTLALPLSVNVRDHFRQEKAFSCFTINTTETAGLRIQSMQMKGLQSTRPRGSLDVANVVFPGQPAVYTFAFERPSLGQQPSTATLIVTYRCIRDEVQHLLRAALSSTMATESVDLKFLLDDLAAALVVEIGSLRSYALFNRLQLPSYDDNLWRSRLTTLYGRHYIVDEALAALRALHQVDLVPVEPLDVAWRQLEIPVERPVAPIICQTSIELPVDCLRLTAGQPINADLRLEASLAWSAKSEPAEVVPQRLAYDVHADLGDWLLAGRKKGELMVREGDLFSTTICLVPLRIGRLYLPRVTVSAVASNHAPPTVEVYQANAAQQIDVVPSDVRSTFVVDL